jgi:hypothetical protein
MMKFNNHTYSQMAGYTRPAYGRAFQLRHLVLLEIAPQGHLKLTSDIRKITCVMF